MVKGNFKSSLEKRPPLVRVLVSFFCEYRENGGEETCHLGNEGKKIAKHFRGITLSAARDM